MMRHRRLARLTATLAVIAAVILILVGRDRSPRPATHIRAAYCRSNQLAVAVGRSGVAMGSAGVVIYLVNDSTSSCSLDGYPTLQLLVSASQSLQTVMNHGPAMTVPPLLRARMVRLAPGDSAMFYTGYRDGTGLNYQCRASNLVAITPPHDLTPITGNLRLAPFSGASSHARCGVLSVSPVLPPNRGPHRRHP